MQFVSKAVTRTICVVMLCLMAVTMVIGTGCVEAVMDHSRPKIVRLYDKTISSVVLINIDYEDEWGREMGWCGSGVLIKPGLIITAGHVLGACDQGFQLDPNMITITTYDGKLLEVIEAVDGDYTTSDLGFLRVEMNGFEPYYPEIDVTTDIGEEIIVVGAPAGMYPMMTHGFIAGPLAEGMPPESLNMQIDCAVNGGNSGGPMFDMDGDLIGIVVALPGRVIGLAWCEPASGISEMLDNWKNGNTLPKEERSWDWMKHR